MRERAAVVRVLRATDRDKAERLAGQYLGESGLTALRDCLLLAPEFAFAAVVGGRVVGVCFGRGRDDEDIVIDGIAVEASAWRRGIGSALLAEFERAAALVGRRRISVGSAPGSVERFYTANGYVPIAYYVTVARREAPLPDDLEIVRERTRGDSLTLNLRSVHGYDATERDRIRDLLGAEDVSLIFEKRIDHPAAVADAPPR